MVLARVERHWYQPSWWLGWLLAPLAAVFAMLSAARRVLYRWRVFSVVKLPCPVVVIGNINVGGVGKTPLTLALIADFTARGVRVGVISRGYGGSHATPRLVRADSRADEVGDEPLLFAAAGVPVAVGRDRAAAGRLLLAAHPEVELILSDDGLQHYRLQRELEIVVMDGARGVGNGHLLPAGPLRESLARLRSVDALVVNGQPGRDFPALPLSLPCFGMHLMPGRFQSLQDPGCLREAADFSGQRVVALAGIGHPERFFATLTQMGVRCERTLVFPDHHAFCAADLPSDADAVIVTSKDAVKLRSINHARLWALPVAAHLEPDLASWIIAQLKRR